MTARTFTWENGVGAKSTVAGVASVVFAPTHIVFNDAAGGLVLAVHADRVRELRETTNDHCGDATCADDHPAA